jgi:hypothetical protein
LVNPPGNSRQGILVWKTSFAPRHAPKRRLLECGSGRISDEAPRGSGNAKAAVHFEL